MNERSGTFKSSECRAVKCIESLADALVRDRAHRASLAETFAPFSER